MQICVEYCMPFYRYVYTAVEYPAYRKNWIPQYIRIVATIPNKFNNKSLSQVYNIELNSALKDSWLVNRVYYSILPRKKVGKINLKTEEEEKCINIYIPNL